MPLLNRLLAENFKGRQSTSTSLPDSVNDSPVRVIFEDLVLRVPGGLKRLSPTSPQGTWGLKGLSPASPKGTWWPKGLSPTGP